MNMHIRKLALASAIAIAFVAGPMQAGSASQDVIDARKESQIWTTYALNPYLRANDINVSVRDGKATLTGKVEEDVNKDLAKQIALGVDGITSVDNQIGVEADYQRPDRGTDRSYADMVDDAGISAAVKSKLAWNRHTAPAHVGVTTMHGNVTLTGKVETTTAKDLGATLALNTRGVNAVDNQLVVSGSVDSLGANIKRSAGYSGDEIADSWITTKVKSTFIYSSNVDSAAIEVSTRRGVVTLSGQMDSGAERALAIELARNVRGVKTVESDGLKI